MPAERIENSYEKRNYKRRILGVLEQDDGELRIPEQDDWDLDNSAGILSEERDAGRETERGWFSSLADSVSLLADSVSSWMRSYVF